MVTPAKHYGPKMWSERMFVYAEGSYKGYGNYTGTEWNLTKPKTDDSLAKALSNPASANNPEDYSGNLVFGMDFTHGRCLAYEPRLDLGFRAKFGTDVALEAQSTLRTTKNDLRPGVSVLSETSIRAQAGFKSIELKELSTDAPLRYEADIKQGVNFRFANGDAKVRHIFEVVPYVGFGIEGATGNEPLNGKLLFGSKLRWRIPHHKYTGMHGGHFEIDVNNKEAKVQAGIGL